MSRTVCNRFVRVCLHQHREHAKPYAFFKLSYLAYSSCPIGYAVVVASDVTVASVVFDVVVSGIVAVVVAVNASAFVHALDASSNDPLVHFCAKNRQG